MSNVDEQQVAFTGSVHPAADKFPLIEGEEFQALVESIRRDGLQEPLWLDREGTLLDGRNRLRACGEAQVTPSWRVYAGDDVVDFIVRLNVHRRHLTTGQKAMIAVDLLPDYEAEARAKMLRGKPDPVADLPQGRAPLSRDRAAKAVGTSGRAVAQAKAVKENAPDLAEQVADGALSLDAAEKEVRKRQRAEAKAAAVAEIAAAEPAPLAAVGTFPVVYVDPPWRYDFAASSTRQIENHYPTMELDDIKALPIPADDDAVLLMWATSPKLREAFEVLDAWGFSYVTSMVWVKDRIGMGYYARSRHELLLIAKRGSLPVPDPEDRPDSVIEAPISNHSAKPERVYELIERMYPTHRKVELFARRQRNGWASWGNQAAVA